MAYSKGFSPEITVNYVEISWTTDGSGNYSEADIPINGIIIGVTTDPGATAPSDNWDMTLTDAYGLDVFMGGGANRDTTTTERFCPVSTASDGTTKTPVATSGLHTFVIANGGAAKIGRTIIYFR